MQVLNNQYIQLIAGGVAAAPVITCVEDVLQTIDGCIGIASPALSQILQEAIKVGQQVAAEDGPAIQAAVIKAISELKMLKL